MWVFGAALCLCLSLYPLAVFRFIFRACIHYIAPSHHIGLFILVTVMSQKNNEKRIRHTAL